MLKKCLASILIILILITSLPVTSIANFLGELEERKIELAANERVTEKDLTNLVTGDEASHTHIYEKKYNDTQHWEECWICGNKKDISSHKLETTGEGTCETYIITRCTEGCGYNKSVYVDHQLQLHDKNTIYDESGGNTNKNTYYHILGECKVCKIPNIKGGTEDCYDSKGQRITCANRAKCKVCGFDYSTLQNVSHQSTSLRADGKTYYCSFCNKDLYKVLYTEVVQDPKNNYHWTIRGIFQLLNNIKWDETKKDALPTYSPIRDTALQSLEPGKVTDLSSQYYNNPAYGTSGISNGLYMVSYEATIKENYKGTVFVRLNADNCFKNVNNKSNEFAKTYALATTIRPDTVAPTITNITVSKDNKQVDNFSQKATIKVDCSDNYSDVVYIALYDSKGNCLADYGTAEKTSNNALNNTFTRTMDIVAEIRESETLTVKVKDRYDNESQRTQEVNYIDAVAPTLTSSATSDTNWSKNKQITYTTLDKGVEKVQIAFNTQSDFQTAIKSGDNYTRTYNFVGDVYGSVVAALYIKDGLDNIRTEKVTISYLDNTKPTIVNATQTLAPNKKSSTLTITSTHDENATLKAKQKSYIGSGVVGYAMTTTNTPPKEESFGTNISFNVTQNGTYYLWAKDKVGNISEPKIMKVTNIEVDITGTITWNDQSDKYHTRQATRVTIYGKINGSKTQLGQAQITAGQTSYTIPVRQVNDEGQSYTYEVVQDNITGYETLVSGSNHTYNITNNLILPSYTSSVTMTPVDSFENKPLKNGKVNIVGIITASSSNKEKVGACNEQVTFQIDSGISIDSNSIKVIYTNADGTNTNLKNYTLNGNTITATFESNKKQDITAGHSLKIELTGTLQEIKQYTSNITYTGYLREYKNGQTTSINLGTLTQASNTANEGNVQYQLPQANIQIKKTDSITENPLTNATFVLYEWNGTEYAKKETITDNDGDGIYQSSFYRWNKTTQGKYKIVEETNGVPEYHKDSKFSMEYTINQLKEQNYTVEVDYQNDQYKIQYGEGNPDDLDKIKGVVENEPWKLKAQIVKIDEETQNIVESDSNFTIYQWNKDTQSYEEYMSYTTGQKVTMDRQEDKSYLSSEWLYYTPNNEGKYKIVEAKAPEGYYGDYDEENDYEGQDITNEGTIKIENVIGKGTIENGRVKAEAQIRVFDIERQTNIAQADATLEGAVYGLYAYENIYHADGVTSRYPGEKGLLYKKGELIMTQTTDAEATMYFEDLECGKYYLKMITAPKGYLKEEKAYIIDLSYQGETVAKVVLKGHVDIQVKKQAFQLYKLKEDFTVLNNAGFSIYLISDLSIVKDGTITRVTNTTYQLNDESAKQDIRLQGKQNEDGTYNIGDLINYYYQIYHGQEENAGAMPGDNTVYHSYQLENESFIKNYANEEQGEDISEIRTDERGYIKSPELAYGEYIIIETSVPRDQEVAEPFVVNVVEDSREPQELRFVIDNNFTTRVKIYKRDLETNQIILKEKASYVIRNVTTNELETNKVWVPIKGYVEYGTLENPFETTDEGYLITPMRLGVGEYVLEEVKAPEGYTLNGYEGSSENGEIKWERQAKLRFRISTNTAYYTDSYLGNYIIVVNQENKAQVGTIKIKSAMGEYLSDIQVADPYQFMYESRAVPGAKYKLIAKENIYTQDNQGTIIYRQGETITYATTDENGQAIIENLPLGKYELEEVEVPTGFSLQKEKQDIEISYQGQEIPVVFKEVAEEETRQKIEITIHNKDAETEEIRVGGKYELYTREEITYQDAEGNEQVIPANEKIVTLTANEDGKIKINKQDNVDLPIGKYYLKEVEAPTGYVLQQEELEIDTTTQDLVEIIEIDLDFYGTQTKVAIQEVNEENEITIGSQFEIRNKETQEVVKSFVTKGEEEIFRKLETNVEYSIVEVKPALGYTTAEEVDFVIKEDGKLWVMGEEQEENIIIIQDYPTILRVEIRDEKTKEYVEETKWQIIKKVERKGHIKEKVMAEWEAQGKEEEFYKLPIGDYILREVDAKKEKGNVTKEDIEFSIKDTKEIQTLEVEQNISKVEIHIIDEETKEKIEDVDIEICDKETGKVIAKTKKEEDTEGEIEGEAEETEEEIIEIERTENGYYLERIPITNYILKQTTPEGYKEVEDIEIEIKDTKDIQIIERSNRKLIYDIAIKKEIENIWIDGKAEKIQKQAIQKIEIKQKELKKVNLEIEYGITVQNIGETTATVGKIIDYIPSGFTVETEGWKVNNTQAIWEQSEKEELLPGESKHVTIKLKWNNSLMSFGEKKNSARVEGSTNPYGYTDKNEENGISEAIAIISIKTGSETIEMITISLISLISLLVFLIVLLIFQKKKYKTIK